MILKSFELDKLEIENHNFYLFYGENEGLKEETIKKLFEKNYQEKIYRYEEKDILNNKDNFFNNILTKSFFDNKKLIIISRTSDKIKDIVEELLEKKIADIQFILNSKILDKKSSLRKFFEKERKTICVPFYEDNNQTLNSIVSKFFRNKKIPISQQLINILIERSRGDRKNLNNELEKIEGFSLNKKKIDLQKIIKLTNLADNYGASELIDHCLAKNTKRTVTILNENNYSDEDNITIIRTLLTKLKRLAKIHMLINKKKDNIENVISSFKPPIFWKDKPLVTQQIKSWCKKGLENLIYRTNEVELLIKKNPNLAKNILFDFLINNSQKTNN
jgi:DNA polymerase-3 subunit delta